MRFTKGIIISALAIIVALTISFRNAGKALSAKLQQTTALRHVKLGKANYWVNMPATYKLADLAQPGLYTYQIFPEERFPCCLIYITNNSAIASRISGVKQVRSSFQDSILSVRVTVANTGKPDEFNQSGTLLAGNDYIHFQIESNDSIGREKMYNIVKSLSRNP